MPAPFPVTDEILAVVKTMRQSYCQLDDIAVAIGCSRTTVASIISRHHIPRPPAPPRVTFDPATGRLEYPLTPEARAARPAYDADQPLPAGHPLTWGLICSLPFPRPDPQPPMRRSAKPAAWVVQVSAS